MLQIAQGKEYRTMADNQRVSMRTLTPTRGEIKITDKFSGEPYTVATSLDKPLVYVVPPDIDNDQATAEKLAAVLNMPTKDVVEKFSDKTKKYVVIKKQISDDEKQKIQDLKLRGVAFDAETVRYYPEGNFMSQLLGFVGYKDEERTGLYGIEQAFNDTLSGKPGFLEQEREVGGAWIFGAKRQQTPAIDGDNILLTIDKSIQFKAEGILKDAVIENEADSGSIMIMDPKTGAILSMANYPSFDPNNYTKIDDASDYTNQTTMGAYEPGSIFKAITMAAAVNEGKVTAQSTYEDTGVVNIDGYKIQNSDHEAHGTQTMTQVLEKSLNTGVIFAKNQIGNKKFSEYLDAFGIGRKTGIEINEVKGDLGNLKGNIEVNYDTASFGQGINITPIQMVQAFGALANNGEMMKPYVVDTKVTGNGKSEKTQPVMVSKPVTSETASTVTAMLVNVVENGHGKKAGVPGYYVAGKTGTAQVARKDGKGYEEDNNIGSFLGYAPASDPKFVMLVRINHPRTVKFAETTAAPAWGKMAQFLLQYYKVEPTRLNEVKTETTE